MRLREVEFFSSDFLGVGSLATEVVSHSPRPAGIRVFREVVRWFWMCLCAVGVGRLVKSCRCLWGKHALRWLRRARGCVWRMAAERQRICRQSATTGVHEFPAMPLWQPCVLVLSARCSCTCGLSGGACLAEWFVEACEYTVARRSRGVVTVGRGCVARICFPCASRLQWVW